MKVSELIDKLNKLKPDAEIYFTDGNKNEWFETFFQELIIDEEDNTVEMLLDTED